MESSRVQWQFSRRGRRTRRRGRLAAIIPRHTGGSVPSGDLSISHVMITQIIIISIMPVLALWMFMKTINIHS